MWIWCKVKKNISLFQIPFWNLINRLVFFLNGVECEAGLKSRGKVCVYNGDIGKIHIGENVRLNSANWANPIGSGHKIWIQMVGKDSVLVIGNDTGISNTAITCTQRIEIGNDVLIGSGVKIFDTDFHALDWHMRNDLKKRRSAPIKIEDGVFIGANAIILKGVVIGKGSVVGTGAVVTRPIPAGQIWAGNPAKFVREV